MAQTPAESVVADCSSAPPWYSSTIQPSSGRSPASSASSKSASCQTVPFRAPTPAMPPTEMETLALAVSGGVFQVTMPVLVMVVPGARPAAMLARKRSTIVCPGASGPETPK